MCDSLYYYCLRTRAYRDLLGDARKPCVYKPTTRAAATARIKGPPGKTRLVLSDAHSAGLTNSPPPRKPSSVYNVYILVLYTYTIYISVPGFSYKRHCVRSCCRVAAVVVSFAIYRSLAVYRRIRHDVTKF